MSEVAHTSLDSIGLHGIYNNGKTQQVDSEVDHTVPYVGVNEGIRRIFVFGVVLGDVRVRRNRDDLERLAAILEKRTENLVHPSRVLRDDRIAREQEHVCRKDM